MPNQTDFQLATRRAKFWGDQLDIAELLGEQSYIEHAAEMYFGAAQWLVRIAIDDIKAQENFRTDLADCTSTHLAFKKAVEKNKGCTCDPVDGTSPHWEVVEVIGDDYDPILRLRLCDAAYRGPYAVWFASKYSIGVRDKIDAMVAETLCHQTADLYGDAYSSEKQIEKQLAAEKARRIPARNELLQRRADRRAGLKPRRPRPTPAQKIANRRRRKFGRSQS